MNPIQLTSATYRVTAIKKPTRAAGFRLVNVGDLIRFHMDMRRVERNQGLHASYVTLENVTYGLKTSGHSQTQAAKVVEECFELEEVSDHGLMERVLEHLKATEWNKHADGDYCYVCGCDEPEGHAEDCSLHALIQEVEEALKHEI